MRVLVTGALGSLGRLTVAELRKQGHQVRAFDLPTRKNRLLSLTFDPGVQLVWGDLRDDEAVDRAVRGVDAVVHDAAMLPPATEKAPEIAHDVNVGGTRRILEAMKRHGVRGPIVYASSVTVVGTEYSYEGLVDGSSPAAPVDVYSRCKVECEELLASSGLPFVALRVGVVLSDDGGQVSAAALRMVFEVDPRVRVEVIHAADVALAQANAVTTEAAFFKILPCGGGPSCQITYGQLFEGAFGILQVGTLPRSAFGRAPYYTGWMDTEESEALLRYQRRSHAEVIESMQRRFAVAEKPLRALRPLTRRLLLRLSGPYRGHPPKPTWRHFVEAERG